MARNTWYRLDNVGKFYSSQAGSPRQTVFRFSATLVEDVDPETLQYALIKTVELFPNFNVCLRSGVFWHYLEPSGDVPLALPETLPVCYGLHLNARSVLFRVTYHGPRVNFEVSHMVSDGRGSLSFFKALIYIYLRERYHLEGISVEYDGSDHQKAENSFDKYFEPESAGSTHVPKAYRLRGWHDVCDPTFMELHLPVSRVLGLAHEWGVSLTSLLAAVLVVSLRDEMPRKDRGRTICFDIPVDLRSHFKSTTAMNFFGLAYLSYTPGDADEPVEEVARAMNAQLKAGTRPDHLKLRMNRMVELEKNPLLRFAPLFMKDLVLGIADAISARGTTATVSNIGAIRIDERLVPYVRDFNILTSTTGLKFTICSFGDDLSVGMATAYSNHAVLKNFCRFFTARGIPARMNVSKSREEVAADMMAAEFERSVMRLGAKDEGEKAQAEDDAEPAVEAEGDATGTAPKGRKASKKASEKAAEKAVAKERKAAAKQGKATAKAETRARRLQEKADRAQAKAERARERAAAGRGAGTTKGGAEDETL